MIERGMIYAIDNHFEVKSDTFEDIEFAPVYKEAHAFYFTQSSVNRCLPKSRASNRSRWSPLSTPIASRAKLIAFLSSTQGPPDNSPLHQTTPTCNPVPPNNSASIYLQEP